jgi:hypothetical protein
MPNNEKFVVAVTHKLPSARTGNCALDTFSPKSSPSNNIRRFPISTTPDDPREKAERVTNAASPENLIASLPATGLAVIGS